MTFKSYFDHSEPIFNELQILNLHKINDYLTSLFMFRNFHLQNLPELFTSYFFPNKEIHNHNTRNSSLLHKKSSRTNYAKHTLANKGIEVWNNLSEQHKTPWFYDSFKKISKTTSHS